MISTRLFFLFLVVVAALAVLLGLLVGSVPLGINELAISLLSSEAAADTHQMIVELRLTRILTAFAVGGLLAIAGALMQVLLRNPLADPYVLGTSGGAAVGALAAMSVGAAALWIDLFAFSGALLAMLCVFAIAKQGKTWSPDQLLLIGIVLASGFSAITTLIIAISPDQRLRGMLFWLMGDLGFVSQPLPLLGLLLLLAVVTTAIARHLNILARGSLQAQIVGMPVARVRIALFTVVSFAIALTVTHVGVIGFVGLVVPHLIRLLIGGSHRVLIPASAIAGGTLLIIADTLSRSLMAPRQLPVGALTAAIGVPLFLFLMWKTHRKLP